MFNDFDFVNQYSDSYEYYTAVITIGFYPQIAIRETKDVKMIYNNIKGSLHPSSVYGLNKKHEFACKFPSLMVFTEIELSTNNLVFYKTNAYIPSVVPLLLCFALDDNESILI